MMRMRALGILHRELRRLGSLIMAADANQVPAGAALAVDRDGFSTGFVTEPRLALDPCRARGDRGTAPGHGMTSSSRPVR